MRDVEDAAVRADRAMLGDDAVVLDWHVPAGEGDHPRAEGDVPLEEWGPLKRLRHASDGNEKTSGRGASSAELEKWGPPRPFPA